jgi:hypothetical protein
MRGQQRQGPPGGMVVLFTVLSVGCAMLVAADRTRANTRRLNAWGSAPHLAYGSTHSPLKTLHLLRWLPTPLNCCVLVQSRTPALKTSPAIAWALVGHPQDRVCRAAGPH